MTSPKKQDNPYVAPKASSPTSVAIDVPGERTSFELRVRLSVMMFLQYFVQGAFAPVVSLYLEKTLGFSSTQIGYFNATMALGPLCAPFLVGQLVDRRFATQNVLAAFHFLAGLLMLLLWMQRDYWPVMVLAAIYSILFIPTMMVANTLAFAHLKDRNRDFPIVRLFGTVGYIVPAWPIEMFWLPRFTGEALIQQRGIILFCSGIASIVMAIYSLTLPATPPAQKTGEFAPLAASRLLFQRNFFVLVVVTIIIGSVHQYFFSWNGSFLHSIMEDAGIKSAWEQRISTIGQVAEIVVMFYLGSMLLRLGFKRTMLLGGLAYMVRCLVLAWAASLAEPFALRLGLALSGQALHGFCFGCFLAVAFMYVDRESPKDVRGSAQTLYGTLVLGIGFFTGGLIGGWIGTMFSTSLIERVTKVVDGVSKTESAEVVVRNFTAIWLSGAAMAAVGCLIFALFFPADRPADKAQG